MKSLESVRESDRLAKLLYLSLSAPGMDYLPDSTGAYSDHEGLAKKVDVHVYFFLDLVKSSTDFCVILLGIRSTCAHDLHNSGRTTISLTLARDLSDSLILRLAKRDVQKKVDFEGLQESWNSSKIE